MAKLLQIGELAACAGVSTRTVRFYHQRRLLPEAERDASGYRRYGADDVVRLVRIVALAKAGVPLSRIESLLHTEDEDFRAEVDAIDAEVEAQIAQLQEVRRSLQTLHSPDRVALPEAYAEVVGRLRRTGARAGDVDQVRDSWILSFALYGQEMEDWATTEGGQMMLSERNVELMGKSLQLADAATDDPRIDDLVTEWCDWLERNWEVQRRGFADRFTDARMNEMMLDTSYMSPAWRAMTAKLVVEIERRGLNAEENDWPAPEPADEPM